MQDYRKSIKNRASDLVTFRFQIFRNTHSELRIYPRLRCIEIIKIWLHNNYLFNPSGLRKNIMNTDDDRLLYNSTFDRAS